MRRRLCTGLAHRCASWQRRGTQTTRNLSRHRHAMAAAPHQPQGEPLAGAGEGQPQPAQVLSALSAAEASDLQDYMVAIRRDLHRHPELGWEEVRTQSVVCARLEELGIALTKAGKTGVVAEVPGQLPGPHIALRADMDALPIVEKTGLPFASSQPGVMHACGHDGHTAMLLGAARLLTSMPTPPRLPVRLLFQPAEELNGGALDMIAHGCLDGVRAVFGGHLDRTYPVGTIIAHDGCVNASVDTFEIVVVGKGGHGARPQQCRDPIVAGAELVLALQTIVSRRVHPDSPAVLTVGKGTIRTVSPETQGLIKEAVDAVCRGVATAHGVEITLAFADPTPPVVNSPALHGTVRAAAAEVVGADTVLPLPVSNMGGEDFSFYLTKVPGYYVRYGAAVQGEENRSAHSSTWDFNEATLTHGARYLAAVALRAGQDSGVDSV